MAHLRLIYHNFENLFQTFYVMQAILQSVDKNLRSNEFVEVNKCHLRHHNTYGA